MTIRGDYATAARNDTDETTACILTGICMLLIFAVLFLCITVSPKSDEIAMLRLRQPIHRAQIVTLGGTFSDAQTTKVRVFVGSRIVFEQDGSDESYVQCSVRIPANKERKP